MFHCDICDDLVEDEDMCSCEERGEMGDSIGLDDILDDDQEKKI